MPMQLLYNWVCINMQLCFYIFFNCNSFELQNNTYEDMNLMYDTFKTIVQLDLY